MLAGRKLLLADDSVTIQKVIDLTFADEGVEVIAVGDGEAAIEKLEQLIPDVVLADVFMPGVNGYAVCEYIKRSEKLKHIPVMLLVGSFEPFDEAEARRVGANDILTKPFQSIRRLIEKVGELVSTRPPEEEVPTAELPKPDPPEEPRLSTAELEIMTADTRQLPADLAQQARQFASDNPAFDRVSGLNKMESKFNEPKRNTFPQSTETLLDLGDFEPAETMPADDFEFELDLDETEKAPAQVAHPAPAFAESQLAAAPSVVGWRESPRASAFVEGNKAATELVTGEARFEMQQYRSAASEQTPAASGNLSPEMIDAIARRAVEHLSERVVQEIAWEVVPQLAELLIKRQLEEKESQSK